LCKWGERHLSWDWPRFEKRRDAIRDPKRDKPQYAEEEEPAARPRHEETGASVYLRKNEEGDEEGDLDRQCESYINQSTDKGQPQDNHSKAPSSFPQIVKANLLL